MLAQSRQEKSSPRVNKKKFSSDSESGSISLDGVKNKKVSKKLAGKSFKKPVEEKAKTPTQRESRKEINNAQPELEIETEVLKKTSKKKVVQNKSE